MPNQPNNKDGAFSVSDLTMITDSGEFIPGDESQQTEESEIFVAATPQSIMYQDKKTGKNTEVKVGDQIRDYVTDQIGEVVLITTGGAQYGTLVVTDMKEPTFYQPTDGKGNPVGEPVIIHQAGPAVYTPTAWKNRILKIVPEPVVRLPPRSRTRNAGR